MHKRPVDEFLPTVSMLFFACFQIRIEAGYRKCSLLNFVFSPWVYVGSKLSYCNIGCYSILRVKFTYFRIKCVILF